MKQKIKTALTLATVAFLVTLIFALLTWPTVAGWLGVER